MIRAPSSWRTNSPPVNTFVPSRGDRQGREVVGGWTTVELACDSALSKRRRRLPRHPHPGATAFSLAGRLLTLARPPRRLRHWPGHAGRRGFALEVVDRPCSSRSSPGRPRLVRRLGAAVEGRAGVLLRVVRGSGIASSPATRARNVASPRRHRRGLRRVPPPAPDPHRDRGIFDLLPLRWRYRALARRATLPADLSRRDRQHDRRDGDHLPRPRCELRLRDQAARWPKPADRGGPLGRLPGRSRPGHLIDPSFRAGCSAIRHRPRFAALPYPDIRSP